MSQKKKGNRARESVRDRDRQKAPVKIDDFCLPGLSDFYVRDRLAVTRY